MCQIQFLTSNNLIKRSFFQNKEDLNTMQPINIFITPHFIGVRNISARWDGFLKLDHSPIGMNGEVGILDLYCSQSPGGAVFSVYGFNNNE